MHKRATVVHLFSCLSVRNHDLGDGYLVVHQRDGNLNWTTCSMLLEFWPCLRLKMKNLIAQNSYLSSYVALFAISGETHFILSPKEGIIKARLVLNVYYSQVSLVEVSTEHRFTDRGSLSCNNVR